MYNYLFKATLLLLSVLLANNVHAGALQDAINTEIQQLSDASAGSLEEQAMEARVKAARSGLYPSLSVSGTEARRRQSVRSERGSLLVSGSNSFNNARYRAIIEQPIFDREKIGTLNEAKVYTKFSEQTSALERNQVTYGLLAAYLEIAKGKEVDESFGRTIDKLTSELEAASKKLELRLITSGQLNTLKLHHLNAKKNRDLSHSATSRTRSFMDSRLLGGASSIPTVPDDAKLKMLTAPGESQSSGLDANIISLKTDIALLEARAKKEKAKRLPKLSLVALYEHDNAAETIFGGPSRIEDYEVGLVLEWDIFKGGYSRHKVRELKLMKRAKEQRLSSALENMNYSRYSHTNAFNDALSRLELEQDMVAFRKNVLDVMVKGLGVGKQDYLSTIDAALLYEESRRSHISAKYNVLTEFVAAHHSAGTLNADAVQQIEALFQ